MNNSNLTLSDDDAEKLATRVADKVIDKVLHATQFQGSDRQPIPQSQQGTAGNNAGKAQPQRG